MSLKKDATRLTDRKRFMKDTRKTVLNFQDLFQSIGTAYIFMDVDDPHFTILEQNEAHARIGMVNREDVIGKPVLEAFPDTSEKFKKTGVSDLVESFRRVVATRKPDVMPEFGYAIADKNGEMQYKYWQVTHFPVFDGKKLVAVGQQSEEVTEKVMTRRQLTRAQEQLQQALAYSAVGTWTWDLENNVVIGDSNLVRLFGLDEGLAQQPMPLTTFTDRIHDDDREAVRKNIRQALKDQTSYESEYRIWDEEGHIRWLLARGRVEMDKDDPEKAVKFPGLVVDITERKLAENNLHMLARASTQFSASLDYRQTLDAIASMIVPGVADWCSIDILEDGKIEQVAVAHKDPEKVKWAKQLRAQQGEVDVNAPSGSPAVIRTGKLEHIPVITDEMLQAAAKDKKELALLRSIGFTSAITAPLKIDGKAIGAITFISTESQRHYNESDVETAQALANRAALAFYNAKLFQDARSEIKARKKLQKELEQLNQALESRVQKRTAQLEKTNAGLHQEIARRHAVEDELQEYSKSLARSNQELQDFAYVASHDLQEPLRKIRAFGDILEAEYRDTLGEGVEYLDRMQNAASRMSILIEDLLAFSRVSRQQQPDVLIDLNTIAYDVMGDLENQIERTGGMVEIDHLPSIMADPTHMRQLFQNLIGNALKFHREGVAPIVRVYPCPDEEAPGMQTICIEDNGIGFDEKYLDRIFSVFQRLHGKDTYEGTGIGLAVVRKIAERYGGTITANSKKGVGSTFKFTFPTVSKET